MCTIIDLLSLKGFEIQFKDAENKRTISLAFSAFIQLYQRLT